MVTDCPRLNRAQYESGTTGVRYGDLDLIAWETNPLFRPCGAIGRLSLSNYLLQSLIGVLLFTSSGLAFFGHGIFLYGKIGPLLDLPITLVIYLAQIPLSQWYLRHYRIGPVEWLWRSLSYGEPQAFRR